MSTYVISTCLQHKGKDIHSSNWSYEYPKKNFYVLNLRFGLMKGKMNHGCSFGEFGDINITYSLP